MHAASLTGEASTRFMPFAARAVGVLVLTQGVVGLVAPKAFFALIGAIQQPPVVYAAAAARTIIGLVLFLAAKRSRMPRCLGALGILIALGGLLTPVYGVRFSSFVLGLWSAGGAPVMRTWAAASVMLGLFILGSLWPREERGLELRE